MGLFAKVLRNCEAYIQDHAEISPDAKSICGMWNTTVVKAIYDLDEQCRPAAFVRECIASIQYDEVKAGMLLDLMRDAVSEGVTYDGYLRRVTERAEDIVVKMNFHRCTPQCCVPLNGKGRQIVAEAYTSFMIAFWDVFAK